MQGAPNTAYFYLDDGHPESRDYDDNYIPLAVERPGELLRRLLGRSRAKARPGPGLPLLPGGAPARDVKGVARDRGLRVPGSTWAGSRA